jgi:hypothetical protein
VLVVVVLVMMVMMKLGLLADSWETFGILAKEGDLVHHPMRLKLDDAGEEADLLFDHMQ